MDEVLRSIPVDWQHIPVEIILEVIFRLPFSPKSYGDLLIVNKRLYSILKTYERSLSTTIAISQFPQLAAIFPPDAISPGRTPAKSHSSFTYLTTLSSRRCTISSIIAKTTDLSVDTTYFLRDSLPQWQRLQKCGLLLLYLLHDQPTYISKLAFIATLPLPSLALLNLATLLGTRVASELGTGIIHTSFASNSAETRSDINLIFGELMFRHGPTFLSKILNQEQEATKEVEWEWKRLDEYQIHEVGEVREKTLGASMREAFVLRSECLAQEVGSRLWKEVQRPELWGVREWQVVQVVGRREERAVVLEE